MRFLKMHGLGNDFVILDHRKTGGKLAPEAIRSISDRHKGVGCDQLIVMEATDKADFFMRIYNPDSSEAEACGNATRCVADIFIKESGKESCTIETLRGLLSARKVGDLVEVDMGEPQLGWKDIPLAREIDTLSLPIAEGNLPEPVAVGMGNPHCVFFVKDISDIDIPKWGPHYEHHRYYPKRTNVEFAQVLGDNVIRLRTWERSSGMTLACGSATCATIVAAVRRNLIKGRKAEILTDGGKMYLEWRESDGHVLMTGPVSYVFEGEFKN